MDFFSTNLFNWYGLAFAIALLVPDIVYIKSNRIDRTIFDNRAMLYIERIGKYCSISLWESTSACLRAVLQSRLWKPFG